MISIQRRRPGSDAHHPLIAMRGIMPFEPTLGRNRDPSLPHCQTRVTYLDAMADGSGIEWTEATWNPTTGCDRISPGCDNCYALTLSKRLKAMGNPKYQEDGDPRTSGPGFAITEHPRRWTSRAGGVRRESSS